MRLGNYKCSVKRKTQAHRAYGKNTVLERHRHRYEVNKKYLNNFEKNGLVASGIDSESGLVEIMELTDKKWFLGCQFHPEFTSTLIKPNKLFDGFVGACRKYGAEKAEPVKGRRKSVKK